MRKQKKRTHRKAELTFHLMLLPAVMITIIFKYLPLGGIVMAFQNYNPALSFFEQRWIGLQNFTFLFQIPDFYKVLWNTVFIAFMKICANLAVPILFALLLNELASIKFKRILQTIAYLPHFISWIALSGVLIDVLSPGTGIVNGIITSIGLKPIFFLGDPKVFPFTMVITDVWKEFGWGCIVYLAAITGIDPTLYEAAVVDGAGRWKQTLHVTLPSIAPIVMLMMVLSIGSVLQAGFDQIVNLYNIQVYSTGDVLDTYIYRVGLIDAQFGLATAVGLLKSVVSMILTLIGYRVADKVAGYRVF